MNHTGISFRLPIDYYIILMKKYFHIRRIGIDGHRSLSHSTLKKKRFPVSVQDTYAVRRPVWSMQKGARAGRPMPSASAPASTLASAARSASCRAKSCFRLWTHQAIMMHTNTMMKTAAHTTAPHLHKTSARSVRFVSFFWKLRTASCENSVEKVLRRDPLK